MRLVSTIEERQPPGYHGDRPYAGYDACVRVLFTAYAGATAAGAVPALVGTLFVLTLNMGLLGIVLGKRRSRVSRTDRGREIDRGR